MWLVDPARVDPSTPQGYSGIMVATLGTPTAATRPRLRRSDNVLAVVFGIWTIIGLFLDGWAHDNNKPESFFTPWHGILYSGFIAAGASALLAAVRDRRPGRPVVEWLPRGHGLTLAALAGFGVGAVGDLLWHEILGIEIGVEALLSPTHLLLLTGGLIALSAPLRNAWVESPREPESLRAFLPTVLSLALLAALVGFFVLYLSPFINDSAGTAFTRGPATPHDHPSTDPAELQQLLGIASILMTTVIVVVPVQLVLRRWRPAAGACTVMLSTVVFLFVGLNEFAQPALALTGVVAGLAADAVARRLPVWAVGAVATVALWLSYFALYWLTEGSVAWTAELWAGATFLAGLIALGIGLLAAPLPSGGPGADQVVSVYAKGVAS